jgi:hypothetical protein
MRVFLKCRRCERRWVEETDGRFIDWSSIGKAHSCPGVDRVIQQWQGLQGFNWASCISGVYFEVRAVKWRPRADGTLTRCDARCMSARGPSCDCQCHGENYGAYNL